MRVIYLRKSWNGIVRDGTRIAADYQSLQQERSRSVSNSLAIKGLVQSTLPNSRLNIKQAHKLHSTYE